MTLIAREHRGKEGVVYWMRTHPYRGRLADFGTQDWFALRAMHYGTAMASSQYGVSGEDWDRR